MSLKGVTITITPETREALNGALVIFQPEGSIEVERVIATHPYKVVQIIGHYLMDRFALEGEILLKSRPLTVSQEIAEEDYPDLCRRIQAWMSRQEKVAFGTEAILEGVNEDVYEGQGISSFTGQAVGAVLTSYTDIFERNCIEDTWRLRDTEKEETGLDKDKQLALKIERWMDRLATGSWATEQTIAFGISPSFPLFEDVKRVLRKYPEKFVKVFPDGRWRLKGKGWKPETEDGSGEEPYPEAYQQIRDWLGFR